MFVLFACEKGKLDLIAKGLGLSAQLKKVSSPSMSKNKFGIRPESHISETLPVNTTSNSRLIVLTYYSGKGH